MHCLDRHRSGSYPILCRRKKINPTLLKMASTASHRGNSISMLELRRVFLNQHSVSPSDFYPYIAVCSWLTTFTLVLASRPYTNQLLHPAHIHPVQITLQPCLLTAFFAAAFILCLSLVATHRRYVEKMTADKPTLCGPLPSKNMFHESSSACTIT